MISFAPNGYPPSAPAKNILSLPLGSLHSLWMKENGPSEFPSSISMSKFVSMHMGNKEGITVSKQMDMAVFASVIALGLSIISEKMIIA